MKAKPTKRKSSAIIRAGKSATGLNYHAWSGGIAALLEEARRQSARHVNAILTATYWEIGRRIVEFAQQGEARAEYGDEVLAKLSRDLTKKFGRGFGPVNLNEMRRFFLTWPTEKIFQTLSENSLEAVIGGQIFQTVTGKLLELENCQTVSGKSPAKQISQTAMICSAPFGFAVSVRFPLASQYCQRTWRLATKRSSVSLSA